MWNACKLLWSLLIGLFRSRASLEAENLVLRQQIIVLRRTAPKRRSFNALDRLIFVGLHRLFPDTRHALAVVRPEKFHVASVIDKLDAIGRTDAVAHAARLGITEL